MLLLRTLFASVLLTAPLLTAQTSGSGTPSGASSGSAAADIQLTQERVQEYVRVRQDIAQLRNEWAANKELIERRIALFEEEKTQLEEQIANARQQTSQAEAEISRARDELNAVRQGTSTVINALPALEDRLLGIVDTLPDLLRSRLSNTPLVTQLREKNRGPQQRMATVIGILNEIEKFNNAFTVQDDQRELGGRPRNVDYLYIGLGAAYYVDRSAEYVGRGVPAEGGWQWTESQDPELAQAVRAAILWYRGENKPASFAPLPITIR